MPFDDYIANLPKLIDEAPKNAPYPASVFASFSLAIEQAVEATFDKRARLARAGTGNHEDIASRRDRFLLGGSEAHSASSVSAVFRRTRY